MNAKAEKVTTPVVVKAVAAKMGCYRKDARELLDHFCSFVAEQVAAGKRVQYTGLGIFYPAVVRRGRGAGKAVKVRFRPARELAEKVKMRGGTENADQTQS